MTSCHFEVWKRVLTSQSKPRYTSQRVIRKGEMEEKTNSKLEYIVADSAAFIKNAPLHNLCENVYTVEDVIKEIRSKATRQRLSVLPYRLNFRQPSAEAVLAGNIYKP